jgi:pantoate--beta-alanine ligase
VQLARTIAEARSAVAAARAARPPTAGRRVALVPTMGALHAGHVSLVDAARRDGCWPAVSIFVNPMQFVPGEDFERYPRDEQADLDRCRQAGVELVFLPEPSAMFAPDAVTRVHVAKLTDTLCGPFRPGHFDGVATVVAKLFHVILPDIAYFGAKDAQQLAVIRRMVRDLDFPIEIVACPTVREPDGLALSSRNAYLTPQQRRRALALWQTLRDAEQRIRAGERGAERLSQELFARLRAAGIRQIDYAAVVDDETLQPVAVIERPVLVALAVHLGGTRLIDSVRVDPRAGSE